MPVRSAEQEPWGRWTRKQTGAALALASRPRLRQDKQRGFVTGAKASFAREDAGRITPSPRHVSAGKTSHGALGGNPKVS